MGARVMVMAGGTGGHVFPALAVADELRARGMDVFWLGNPNGFEARIVPGHGFSMESVSIQGLRGNGLRRWLAAPFRLSIALIQVLLVLLRKRPQIALGMGGFVSGPGGFMARLMGIPLVIHEQNAVPGMTNRWLARWASRVAEAFPGSFDVTRRASLTGNPVRSDIAALEPPENRMSGRSGPYRLLILGGSQGARVLNETLPGALALLEPENQPFVHHQAGRNKAETTARAYREAGLKAEVVPFIEDMAAAYAWADLLVCRAGALTIAEVAAAGVAAILVPYPHAVDDHQTKNARYLTDAGAALLLPQSEMSAGSLARLLDTLMGNRKKTLEMAIAARRLALPEATLRLADICEEVAR
ncbi:MAG: undecaprenyldiphospho-muramoylpentapeptide beta-N-acetylglucosaminyltransferase [Gammaproteobacteria bacterium]|nr:undecaprenyldiphospho-muramoylpentapeptide beta-N-acetylglucosaminyltransferase [Gammaproteobacteria bacterium]